MHRKCLQVINKTKRIKQNKRGKKLNSHLVISKHNCDKKESTQQSVCTALGDQECTLSVFQSVVSVYKLPQFCLPAIYWRKMLCVRRCQKMSCASFLFCLSWQIGDFKGTDHQDHQSSRVNWL